MLIAPISAFATPISEHGKLSVGADGIIKDKNGNDYVMRGMSMYWYWGDDRWGTNGSLYSQSNVNSLANDWKVSVVRAALGDRNVSMAKNMMDWTYNSGVYVIIDNHTHTGENEVSASQSFFSDVSAYAKQKGYTHVIYEIFNEPINQTWNTVKNFATSVIPSIRTNDADGIIIVGTPGYSSDIASPRSNPITGQKNIMYTLHFYAGTSGHSNYRNALKAAYCDSLPIFVTEWGTCESSGDGTVNTSNSNTWLSLLEAAKVSYANWSVQSGTGSCDALGSRNSVSSGFTASGNYVKNVISKLNNGGSLSSAGLSETTITCSSNVEPSGPNGRIMFGSNGDASNYGSKNGADSIDLSPFWGLKNTSANFTASYTMVGIEQPGTYLIKFYAASTADGATVSWSGSWISSGTADIKNTGSLAKGSLSYTDAQLLTISEIPETPFNIEVKANSANSVALVYIYTMVADSTDSLEFGIGGGGEPSAVKSGVFGGNSSWKFNSLTRSFDIISSKEGSIELYSLNGQKKAAYKIKGTSSVSLNNLQSGAFVALWKDGKVLHSKTIFLK
ncbi:hypothetical protein AGMMS49938_01280 [Fibrobacterales bacterium]|nr:hypothetical protein AGMMS49938_01280 [Fibrobacterales bacterium]